MAGDKSRDIYPCFHNGPLWVCGKEKKRKEKKRKEKEKEKKIFQFQSYF